MIVYISRFQKYFLNLTPKIALKGRKIAPMGPKKMQKRPKMWLYQKRKDMSVLPIPNLIVSIGRSKKVFVSFLGFVDSPVMCILFYFYVVSFVFCHFVFCRVCIFAFCCICILFRVFLYFVLFVFCIKEQAGTELGQA